MLTSPLKTQTANWSCSLPSSLPTLIVLTLESRLPYIMVITPSMVKVASPEYKEDEAMGQNCSQTPATISQN